MHALRTAIAITWAAFWIYWLISAFGAKQSTGRMRRLPLNGVTGLSVFILIRVFHGGSLVVHSTPLAAIGALVFASGLALAVWARIHLGRNWGMPMTRKQEPELVTSGPYRLIRHPIYTGVLLAMLGTALAADVYWFAAFAITAAYFLYSARVEERVMASAFPVAYAAYRTRTKMLIPFVL